MACAEGYKGVLCTQCIGFNDDMTKFYVTSGNNGCALCKSTGIEVA